MRRIDTNVETSGEQVDTELMPESDPRSSVISIDPERMSGTPCFRGTRVPVQTLWDHLEAGDSPSASSNSASPQTTTTSG